MLYFTIETATTKLELIRETLVSALALIGGPGIHKSAVKDGASS